MLFLLFFCGSTGYVLTTVMLVGSKWLCGGKAFWSLLCCYCCFFNSTQLVVMRCLIFCSCQCCLTLNSMQSSVVMFCPENFSLSGLKKFSFSTSSSTLRFSFLLFFSHRQVCAELSWGCAKGGLTLGFEGSFCLVGLGILVKYELL